MDALIQHAAKSSAKRYELINADTPQPMAQKRVNQLQEV